MSGLSAIRLGFGITLGRFRARSMGIVVVLALSLTAVNAIIERTNTSAGSLDRSLTGLFGVLVPLTVFAICAIATGRHRLADATWEVARFGVPRSSVALGVILSSILVTALLGLAMVAITVGIAHGATSLPMAQELFTIGWILLLVGAAYVGWFSFGATFFRFGSGRLVALIFDFAFGATAVGIALPRGHALNLLGLGPVQEMAQPASSIMLLASAVALSMAAAIRSPS